MLRGKLSLLALCLAPVLATGGERNHSWEVLANSVITGRSVVVKRMNLTQVEGKLLAIDSDSITVKWRGSGQVIERRDVFRVRYANTRRRNTLLGMGIGTATGAIIGVASSSSYREAAASVGAILGVGLGALGGGVVPIGAPLYEIEKPAKQARVASPDRP